MLQPDDISVGDVMRLKSGSPKMIVTKILGGPETGGALVRVLLWSDQVGFVREQLPLEFLVRPRNIEEAK